MIAAKIGCNGEVGAKGSRSLSGMVNRQRRKGLGWKDRGVWLLYPGQKQPAGLSPVLGLLVITHWSAQPPAAQKIIAYLQFFLNTTVDIYILISYHL